MCVPPVSLLRVALCAYLVAARDAEIRQARQHQRANAAATAAAALRAMHEETTRLAGEHKGDCVISNVSVGETAVLCKKYRDIVFRCLYVMYLSCVLYCASVL